MESLFKGYYQPTPEQFKELWEEGTFVFDTNVLLGLYRYKKESRDEVLNVIKKIKDRIWIPYQVGLEFHRNRLTVLGEQNSSLATIKTSIRDSIDSIEKKCKDLDLDKRHSEVETSSFIERFRDLSESVINELDEIKAKKLTNDIEEDVVLTELTKLFSVSKGSLGSPPKDQKVLENIYKDGEFRAKNKIPPSFKDILEAQKNKSGEEYYAFEGLNYKKGFGDLIVWKQIIEFAQEHQKKNIIFVTDDTKEDWMRIINSHGKKTISARPELVSEIFKEAGVETFYIYDTKSFLDYSKEYFNIEVSDETMEDIQKIFSKLHISYSSKSKFEPSSLVEKFNTNMLVEKWLKEKYTYVSNGALAKYCDYLAVQDYDRKEAIYLKYLDDSGYNNLEESIVSNLDIISNFPDLYDCANFILIIPAFKHQYRDIENLASHLENLINEKLKPQIIFKYSKLQVLFTLICASEDNLSIRTIFEYEFNN
jgi:predicted nucleic acid-binding protein